MTCRMRAIWIIVLICAAIQCACAATTCRAANCRLCAAGSTTRCRAGGCRRGYFFNKTGVCQKCPTGCSLCFDGAGYCHGCQAGLSLYAGKCVAKVPAGAGTLKPGGVYALVADSGKLLARCFGCFSGTYSNVATVHVPAPANLSLATVDPYARWVVQAIPKLSGQVTLRVQDTKDGYLQHCSECVPYSKNWENQVLPDVLAGASCVWTVESLNAGIVRLISHNVTFSNVRRPQVDNLYLARCSGCYTENRQTRQLDAAFTIVEPTCNPTFPNAPACKNLKWKAVLLS